MQEKKNFWNTKWYGYSIVTGFFLLLAGFAVAGICIPDKTISEAERRYYETFPELSVQSVMDGSYMEKLENYLLDQFAGRDVFRSAKTELETNLLGKADANGYVKAEGYLFELDLDWSKQQVTKTAQEFAKLCEEWFSEAEVYYAVIPDKASFLPKEYYPVGENSFLAIQLQEQLTDATYIDLYPYLTLEDYYKTDLHWKQESIVDVADVLLDGMLSGDGKGQTIENEQMMVSAPTGLEKYESQLITSDFYGGYAGASAFFVQPDELIGLTNEVIENARVYDYETGKECTIYAPEKVDGTDPYDYYLWGARALLTIENPACENGKKLLLFRDSFGSSIAPLLLEGYQEITLVDLRYVTSAYLPQLIDVENYEDVLFLYSENILRNSGSLKF